MDDFDALDVTEVKVFYNIIKSLERKDNRKESKRRFLRALRDAARSGDKDLILLALTAGVIMESSNA